MIVSAPRTLCVLAMLCMLASGVSVNAQVPEAELAPGDPAFSALFGDAVGLDGDVAVVGARSLDASAGAAYVFRRSGAVWSQEAKLVGAGVQAGDAFGHSVALSGPVLAVGAPEPFDLVSGSVGPGSVHVYRHNGSTWMPEAVLSPPGGQTWDQFGFAVALDGNVLVVGAPGDEPAGSGSRFGGTGSVRIYRHDGSTWVDEGQVIASDGGQAQTFGHAVSVSGTLLLVGAPGDDVGASDAGAGYAFRYGAGTWSQEAKLTAPSPAASDHLGFAVAADGTAAVLAAPLHDGVGTDSGRAHVFRNAGSWSHEATLVSSSAAAGDSFGASAALAGDVLLVGAYGAGGGAGQALVFEHAAGGWNQVLVLSAPASIMLGASAALSAGRGVLGAPLSDGSGVLLAGAAHVFGLLPPPDCNGNGTPDDQDIAAGTSQDCNGNGVPDECDIAAGTSSDCNSDGIPDECQADCNGNGVPDDCDLSAGTSQDCNGNGVPDECDIAAGTSSDCNSDGIPDECQSDCNGNGVPDDCDLSAGTSQDCNGNGIPDECDIAAGVSADCNGDGIPDECQTDCNGNGVPDDCDIAAGTSQDCNGNGVPDECDLSAGTSQDVDGNGVPDECQPDCNGNGLPDAWEVTQGLADDCNGNGLPDECDIASGTSSDCNADGIPDECQGDCNGNGVPDDCDLSAGTSQDCNGNGIPDECDLSAGTSQDVDGNGVPDECQPDCDGNGFPDTWEIAQGLAADCNRNGVPDSCDIANGPSTDLNGNGIPDECEGDCNGNGVPDDLDLLLGSSQDCNDNEIPDECDIVSGASLDVNSNGVPDECEPDCNGNGLPDAWELAQGLADDCNGNGLPDECDIALGTSFDLDGNGVPDECQGQFVDLGNGKSGSTGTPVLSGAGTLIGGDLCSVTLSGALPSSSSWLVMGFGLLNAPIKGGVLVPTPDIVISGIPVNGAGQVVLPFEWPLGVPGGFSSYAQFWISDAGASQGVSASNGLALIAAP